jgi:hypothetical protein
MNDPLFVRGFQGVRDLRRDRQGLNSTALPTSNQANR